jgi:UDP-glucuronate 4-epimerase
VSRYVVTGAAGFIGSHLVDALLARGDDVVAVDSFTDYYDPARKEDNAQAFEVRRLDLADETLELDGVHGVFHLAAQAGVRPSFEHFDVYLRRNVLATQRLLESAVAAGTRVVFASSSSVYGDAERYPTTEDADLRPISPYGITKLAAERLVAAYPIDAVVLRYFTVYGPRQRPDMGFSLLIDALLDDREFELFGDPSRSFTFVGDVVEATIAAMERAPAGAVYNVGGGQEATLREAIAALELVSGRAARIRQGDRARGDARRTAADVERIREGLAWTPTTSLEDGLRAQWSWAADRVAAR